MQRKLVIYLHSCLKFYTFVIMKIQIFLLSLLCILFSCSRPTSNQKIIFRYNDASGITSLDPLKANNLSNIWAVQQLYNGLLQLDEDGNLQACIAHDWEMKEEGRLLILHLRTDILFHPDACFENEQERKLTAQDVIFSFQRIAQDPAAAWILQQVAEQDGKKQIFAPNDSTVQIYLTHPSLVFLSMLTMPYGMIVSEKAVQFYGTAFRNHPVGTGPFLLRKWHEQEKLILNKNGDYFEFEKGERLPYLDGVAVTFIKDRQTELLEFLQGNLDMMSGLDAAFKDELLAHDGTLKSKYAHQVELIKRPYLNTEYLGFQLSDETSIFQNKYLRQTLSYAIDREKLISMIRNNVGDASVQGIVPKALRKSNQQEQKYAFNLEKMKESLLKAGYQHPSEVPSFVLTVDVAYTDLATILLNQWKNAGFQVKLDVVDRPTLKSSVAKGHLAFFRASWIGDYPDAENYLSLFYSRNWSPNGPNYTHFKNEKFDNWFDAAQREMNLTIRDSLYNAMDELMMAEAPIIVLYYDEVVRFVQKSVKALRVNSMNGLNLTRTKK